MNEWMRKTSEWRIKSNRKYETEQKEKRKLRIQTKNAENYRRNMSKMRKDDDGKWNQMRQNVSSVLQ